MTKTTEMRPLRLLLALATACAVLLSLGAAAAFGFAGAGVHADSDGDKIYDDLERLLEALPADGEAAVIVQLRAPATAARVDALARDAGAFEVGRRFTLIDGFAARMSRSDALALAQEVDVVSIEGDLELRATNGPAQDAFGVAKARLDAGLDGNAVGSADTYEPGDLVAAVLDTGIDAAHLDLDDGKVLAFASCLGGSCAPTSPSDSNGHGTHVAATIAGDGEARPDGRDRGVAPAAALVGVQVLAADGSGTMSDFIAGLQWVVAQRTTYGIEVVNASLGADGCSSGTDAASTAVNSAVGAGLVVVVSAGNEGPDRCTISTPAAAAGAVTVGAMSDLARDGFALAPFSSRGPTFDNRVKPDVLAPGVAIVSAYAGTSTGYAAASGTSMASPFVAGVALLMLEANPALTPAEVKSRIAATAVDWGTAGSDTETGAGRLDAYAAIAAAGAPLTAPPAVPTRLLRTGAIAAPGLSVDLPLTVLAAGYPLAVTSVAPTWATGVGTPDFDLTLLSSAGSVVASGSTAYSSLWPARLRHEGLAVPSLPAGTYTLRVTAAAGSGPYVIDLSGGFAPAPRATVPPTVAGDPVVGATLTAGPGTWEAAGPVTLSYQWSRCTSAGTACIDVAGADDATYAVPATDLGARLQVAVTATDASGAATAVSAPTAVIGAAPDAAPAVRAVGSRGRRGRSVRLLYRVTDDGGRASERIQVFRGRRLVKTIRTPLSARETGRTYYVFWRAPNRRERLRFCVRATDAGGRTSATSCASLMLR